MRICYRSPFHSQRPDLFEAILSREQRIRMIPLGIWRMQ